MKQRNDFVSNSSSSSFIVINDKGNTVEPNVNDSLTVPSASIGCAEFGWQTHIYRDFGSKLNWCAIIVNWRRDCETDEESGDRMKSEVLKPWFRSEEMTAMLKRVCEKHGIYITDIVNRKDRYDGDTFVTEPYIDHQSVTEENGRMFRDDRTLEDFLFNDSSYIDNSNDNGGRDVWHDNHPDESYPVPRDYE